MFINGLEANFLLYALDEYLGVNQEGKLQSTKHGYTLEELQDLRDRLFAAHEHPEDDESVTVDFLREWQNRSRG